MNTTAPELDEEASTSLFSESLCLSENLVVAFVTGHASERERSHIEAHLDQCTACADLVFLAAHARDVSTREPEAPWPTAFSVGSVLAERFTIWRFVARGGMGEVYEAFDQKVPERVALKTMLCTLSDNEVAVRRLCEEVKLARRIAHRHICRIHELHEHRDAAPSRGVVHFLAMEFVDGETLKARLARGALPPRMAGRIARQLLEGLAAAHAAGVLHLDFKSQNVMLRAGVSPPEAVIMDFSLSRALEAGTGLSTSDQKVVGSPGYMSPEQLECRAALGPASDLYSFGIVLFEMLTGRLPFHGERAASMMAMQLERATPSPSQALPGLTPAFDQFVAKCLAREPAARFADAASALEALDRCLELPLDRASKRRRLVRRATSGLLVAVPLGLGVLLSHWSRWPMPAASAPSAALSVSLRPLAANAAASQPVPPSTGGADLDVAGLGEEPALPRVAAPAPLEVALTAASGMASGALVEESPGAMSPKPVAMPAPERTPRPGRRAEPPRPLGENRGEGRVAEGRVVEGRVAEGSPRLASASPAEAPAASAPPEPLPTGSRWTPRHAPARLY